MSLFGKIFSGESSADHKSGKWKKIESAEDLQRAVEASYKHKVVIFKHSTRCFISKTVLGKFEKSMENYDGDAEFYILDLLAYRPISNQIESDFGVTHQSPQIIVLENGAAVNNASHQDISIDLV